ncbi:hypothetical protein FQ021_28165, partial [Escherichia coli]|nr:hypothetical protein [Escherichia coli]
ARLRRVHVHVEVGLRPLAGVGRRGGGDGHGPDVLRAGRLGQANGARVRRREGRGRCFQERGRGGDRGRRDRRGDGDRRERRHRGFDANG